MEKYKVEVVKIINPKQASMYIKHGVKPLDLYWTDRVVYVFGKEETNSLYSKWLNRELV